MFRDDAWWEQHDRAMELADACMACERHVSVCRCNVRALPRLRVARPMPAKAGDLLHFPLRIAGNDGPVAA
jgi:hypothetical protein